MWESCKEWREEEDSWQEALGWVLGEEGEGKWWMRELEEARVEGREGISLEAAQRGNE